MRKAEILFQVELDDEHLPEKLNWKATDSTGELQPCTSVLMSVWDHRRQTTLRVDRWTKDMPVDEMKRVFYERLITMHAPFKRPTGENKNTEEHRDYIGQLSDKKKIKN